jgi:acyl transferase domain-containing protein
MTISRSRYECDQSTAILPDRPWHLLVLSARSAASLEAATMNLAEHLQRNRDLAITDVAFTLQVGRRLFEHRRIVVCRDLAEAIEALTNSGDQRVHTFPPAAKKPGVAFVFPGESLAVNTALELYETEPVFAGEIGRLAEELKPFLGFDVRPLLYPREPPLEATRAALQDASAAAAALFAIEYAVARLWQSWGVSPAAVMGHGSGEYTSACIAGLIEPADAAALAVARGRVLTGELEQTAFAKLAKSVRLRPVRLPCVSGVTGTWMPEAQPADAGYWLKQLQWTSAVDTGIETLASDGIGVLVQVGPGHLPYKDTRAARRRCSVCAHCRPARARAPICAR